MYKKNIFIINSKPLYDIFDEVKDLFDFNVFEVNDNDLKLSKFDKEPNSIFLSFEKNKYLHENNRNKLVILEDLPLSLIKIIEKVNLLFLKVNYQLKSEIEIKNYIFNLNNKTIQKNGKKIKLTEKELEIILFLSSKQEPQKTQNLQSKIWNYNTGLETHTVETHIYRLRKKIEIEFGDTKFILSGKKGYSFY